MLGSVSPSSPCAALQHYHNTNHSSNNNNKWHSGLNGVFEHLNHEVFCINFPMNKNGWLQVCCAPGAMDRDVLESQRNWVGKALLLHIRTAWVSQVEHKLQLPGSLYHTLCLNHAMLSVTNTPPRSFNHPGLKVKVRLTGELSWH